MPPPEPPVPPPEPPEPPDPPVFDPLPVPPPPEVPVLQAKKNKQGASRQAYISDFQGAHDGGNMTFYFFAWMRRRKEDVSAYLVARGHVPA